MKFQKVALIALRYVAAIILVQTLYFKFTAHEESVLIFSAVGMEPWGRILVGALELIAAVMLLLPGSNWLGALLAMGLMAGAIFFHLTRIGIEVNGDRGYLFALAVIVFVASFFTVASERRKIPLLRNFLR